MIYNLTTKQKEFARWLVSEIEAGRLEEEFHVAWALSSGLFVSKSVGEPPVPLTPGLLDALERNDLLLTHKNIETSVTGRTSLAPKTTQREKNRRCVVTAKLYEAVESDFSAPDTSFVRHLSPLADITTLDDELKARCLPILGAGSADPKLWDSAVRTAGVILEERLRDVGEITDASRVGRNLVNDVFGLSGTLASRFENSSELAGHRELYAGVVGTYRNPSAHRFIDPTPEDGGALIVFVNLLLKTLEDLR